MTLFEIKNKIHPFVFNFSLSDTKGIPYGIIQRLKLFEILENSYEAERKCLQGIVIKEFKSNQLNNQFVIKFPKDPEIDENPTLLHPNQKRNSLSEKLRWWLHRVVASMVVQASLQPESERLALNEKRSRLASELLEDKFATLRLTLEDSYGVKYDSVLSGKIQDIMEGRFVLRLGGNNETYEISHFSELWYDHQRGFATFQLNGPGIGRSQGKPCYVNLIKSAKMGLQFLEALIAQYKDRRGGKKGKILLKGFSLGNGILSELLRWHRLNTQEIDFMVYSVNSFSRLSDVPSGLLSQHINMAPLRKITQKICSIGNRLIRLANFEFDCTKAAKTLSDLGIYQNILQAAYDNGKEFVPVDDGVIAKEASLLHHMIYNEPLRFKRYAGNVYYDQQMLSIRSLFEGAEFTHCDESCLWSVILLEKLRKDQSENKPHV